MPEFDPEALMISMDGKPISPEPGYYWGRTPLYGPQWAMFRLHEDGRITHFAAICHTWAPGDHPVITWGPRIPDPPPPGGPG